MNRRDLFVLAGAAVAFPRVAFAQQAAKVPRIVFFEPPIIAIHKQDLQQGLADYGWVDGKNVTVEVADSGTVERLPAVTAMIVTSKPDILVPSGAAPALAMRDATSTIPIVFVNVGDPVGIGLVPSLAHPGGNLTGNSGFFTELAGKQVSILREVVPSITRMAVLYVPPNAAVARTAEQVRIAAIALGIEPVLIGFVDTQDIAPQFDPVVASGAQAAFVVTNAYFNVVDNTNALHDLLIDAKLPAISQNIYSSATHLVLV